MKAGQDREYTSPLIVKVYADLMRDFKSSGNGELQAVGRDFERYVEATFGIMAAFASVALEVGDKRSAAHVLDETVPKRPKI